MSPRSSAATTVLMVCLLAVCGSSAGADTYSVFSCKGPTGASNPAVGWTGFASAIPGAVAGNDCGAGGALFAALPASANGGRVARWRFQAPADTRIVRITAVRRTTGLTKSQQPDDVGYSLTTDPSPGIVETCDTGEASPCVADLGDGLDKQGLDKTAVQFAITCNGDETNTCPRAARADVSSMVIGLGDATLPVVSGVRLVDNGDRSGVAKVAFDAADRGGGLYRTLIKVDGKPFRVLGVGGGTCADANPADADPYQFLVPAPCPLSARGLPVAIDVRSLSSGPHSVEFGVEDAAGNAAVVYGPLEFPRPNGEIDRARRAGTPSVQSLLRARLRVWFDRTHTRRYTSRYGVRVVTRGILRSRAGRPIRGARIDVFHILRDGRRRLLKTGLKTRGGGKLTLILPLNVDTRRIAYVYRAVRPGPVTSGQSLRLDVLRAGRLFYRRR